MKLVKCIKFTLCIITIWTTSHIKQKVHTWTGETSVGLLHRKPQHFLQIK